MRIFRKLTNQDLIEKGRRKPSGERKEPRTPYPAQPSIEFRPEHINSREELGHKEIDLIVGCKGSRAAVLTIADRKCREEMGFRIPDKKAASVRAVFDRLERKLGKRHQREREPPAAQIFSEGYRLRKGITAADPGGRGLAEPLPAENLGLEMRGGLFGAGVPAQLKLCGGAPSTSLLMLSPA